MIIQTPNRGNIENKTNCLTVVPQNIKLTLYNGVLTLKAGSKVFVPDGFEEDEVTPKFNEIVIQEDIINEDLGSSTTTPDIWMIIPSTGDFTSWSETLCFSGSSAPSETDACWYDADENLIKSRRNGETFAANGISLPIAIGFNTENHENDKILTVFNGATYLGSHVFGLPGVKGLTPYGYNPDGTTRNEEVTVDNVVINQLSSTWGSSSSGRKFFFNAFFNKTTEVLIDTRISYNQAPSENYRGLVLDKTENRWISYTDGQPSTDPHRIIPLAVFIGSIASSSDPHPRITKFIPTRVFEEKGLENPYQDYSFSEVDTGERWLDGKKIYRQTKKYDIATYTEKGSLRIFENLVDDWDTSYSLLKAEGFFDLSSGQRYIFGASYITYSNTAALPYPIYASQVIVNTEGKLVTRVFAVDSNVASVTMIVTLYYTKVVD